MKGVFFSLMKQVRHIFLLLLLLSLPALACGLTDRSDTPPTVVPVEVATDTPEPPATDTPEPAPTDTPEPTDTPQPLPTATWPVTATPANTPTPQVVPPAFDLADTVYVHPSGAFSLVPPAGWSIDDDEASASFNAPDETGFIYVQITHTGYELDGPSFGSFVTNRDTNYFDDFDDYEVLGQEVNEANGVATVTKFVTFDGVPQTIVTFYDQYGPIIYSFDFWADADLFDVYDPLYGDILESRQVEPGAAEDQIVYLWVYTFTGPANLFSFEVPTAWEYERTEAEDTIVDTFYSPDGHAVIQNIAYDEGTEITRSMAGALALELLRSFYATDIRIVDDQMQADGSERLIWESRNGDYSGISFLETRGTTFLMLTTMWDNPYEDYYFETLDYAISTYNIPE